MDTAVPTAVFIEEYDPYTSRLLLQLEYTYPEVLVRLWVSSILVDGEEVCKLIDYAIHFPHPIDALFFTP